MQAIKRNIEEEFADHLLSKDQKKFALIYDHFSGALLGIINRIVKNDEQAEDILQDVFLKIWNASDSYDPKKSRLFTWMLNIARNTSIDYLRSKQGQFDKTVQPVERLYFLYEVNGSHHEHIGLKKLVGDLKTEHKEIIDLAFFEGYTQNEIAEILQIPLGTVKTRCRKAISTLRESLSNSEIESF